MLARASLKIADRVPTYRVDDAGSVTLRRGGRMQHIGIAEPTPEPASFC
jgi:hypothetical protein